MGQIVIENLTKRYGGIAAVDGLNLNIDAGQFITLLGPSGCGKTTTLRMLAGFIKPDGGAITVDGKVLSSAGSVVPPNARGMGMVFQSYALWPHKTVFQNVAYGLRMQRPKPSKTEMHERVSQILDVMGLGDFPARYPLALSGGQQQRVALARSLVTEPSILLLDEPLSNLDAKLRDRMREELLEVQRRTGLTFIYVTHDQDEAMSMSDQVAVMHQGHLEQYASPREIYFRPETLRVARFMGLVNLLPAVFKGLVNDDGWCEASLGLGPVVQAYSPEAEALRPGDDVVVTVRPEAVVLHDEPGVGVLDGVVKQNTMLGNICYYLVDCKGFDFRIQTSNAVTLTIGDEVSIDIEQDRTSLFRSAGD